MNDWKNEIEVVKQVNDAEVGWTLGWTILASNEIAIPPSPMPPSWALGVAGVLLVFVIFSFFVFAVCGDWLQRTLKRILDFLFCGCKCCPKGDRYDVNDSPNNSAVVPANENQPLLGGNSGQGHRDHPATGTSQPSEQEHK